MGCLDFVCGSAWLLLCSLVAYLVALLGLNFLGWTRTGGGTRTGVGLIPYKTGWAAQMVYAALLALFVVNATPSR